MENLKAYIESGILELYVLGVLSTAERTNVQGFANLYPEIRLEIEAIEIALKQYALVNAVQPADEVWMKVYEKLGR
ncbi:hypothetical protein [Pedobacter sp. MW01-1-1]|uniref:hypothetical protein n=1 Tax=Pedobacter sp. MW01-1-1 TaxID=3383027 RepID=UPI003FEF2D9C